MIFVWVISGRIVLRSCANSIRSLL